MKGAYRPTLILYMPIMEERDFLARGRVIFMPYESANHLSNTHLKTYEPRIHEGQLCNFGEVAVLLHDNHRPERGNPQVFKAQEGVRNQGFFLYSRPALILA